MNNADDLLDEALGIIEKQNELLKTHERISVEAIQEAEKTVKYLKRAVRLLKEIHEENERLRTERF